jgi:hypothetical protein
MKNFIFISIIILFAVSAHAEENITITTYYPSPYGSYNQLGTNKFAVDINGVALPGEFTAMKNGDAHIGRSLIIGAGGGSGFAYDELIVPPNNLPGDGTLLVKSRVGIGTAAPNATLTVIGSISRTTGTGHLLGTTANTHVNLGWANSITGADSGSNANADFCTIGGGTNNIASGRGSTVSGGLSNTASIGISTVSGGASNAASGDISTVSGGSNNIASNYVSTVSGGTSNTASGDVSTVSGGSHNIASHSISTVSGGLGNKAINNTSTVSGGSSNTASGGVSTVSGGSANTASGSASTVSGGTRNTASGSYSIVSGGRDNIASGQNSTVPGGISNTAGGMSSWAGGYSARASHEGSFVWGDSTSSATKSSRGKDTFNIYASGGFYLNGASKKLDVAEYMDFKDSDPAKEGDLVSLSGEDLLSITTLAYDANLIGVISTKKTTTLHLGEPDNAAKGLKKMPVALAGRCFIKASGEGGPINVGSPITSSNTPGVGMKAAQSGKIIGYAMQGAEFKGKETKEILVFVNLGYYLSGEAIKKLNQQQ